ncbi:glycosyltransferase family 2 protein [Mangrovicoccus sp. HB161399]|uniref:glycosyltransferase family 2 protein n=1 Tax=Mangrovicoccus sp. HB161399 TaxID=2720392 RepID=UPI001553F493|nr:glycosyltransferase family 2 protein [Mangrovicoccus sp. HB161399]
MQYPARITVIVCSLGRPECLAYLWQRLQIQTRPAHRVIVAVPSFEDVPSAWAGLAEEADLPRPEVAISAKGLPRQRNVGLERALDDSDIIVFFDDDYVPSVHALEGIEKLFAAYDEVTGITGKLLADGINGPGIESEAAAQLVDDWEAGAGAALRAEPPRVLESRRGLYGCNMAFRVSAIGDVRFDERLPLYGWQEDIDFGARVPGKKFTTDALVGVHCGMKRGREKRGELLGYSQIANPIYLWRKGSMRPRFAMKLCLRNFLSNHMKALKPEPWVDRRGRLRGNWRAIGDLIRGNADPENILRLP